MTTKTHSIRFTRADGMTQPGGFIIRERSEEPRYTVHTFNRQPGSREPATFYWGGYFDTEAEALDDFERRLDRARRYTAGGSVIPVACETAELAAEGYYSRANERGDVVPGATV